MIEDKTKQTTVAEYIATVPLQARPKFDELRRLVKETLPHAKEIVNYGIIGYKIDDKRARVFISGWKDHVAMYPVPTSEILQKELKPNIKGKGTLWFELDKELRIELIKKAIKELASP